MLFETLESRKLLSASIMPVGSVLLVKYGNGDDQAYIFEESEGEGTDAVMGIRVDQGGVLYTGIDTVLVSLGHGVNNIEFGLQTISIAISGGADADSIMGNAGSEVNVAIHAGKGENSISIGGGASMGGSALINTGSDGDFIFVSDFSTVLVNSGAGCDFVNVFSSYNVTVNGGAGVDNIVIDATGTIIVNGGPGDDVISVDGAGNFFVNGGAGFDALTITDQVESVIPVSIEN